LCYTDNTYTTTETCPSFVTLAGKTFTVVSSDSNVAGSYFYDVSTTTTFGVSESVQYELTVTDGCVASTLSNTNAGN